MAADLARKNGQWDIAEKHYLSAKDALSTPLEMRPRIDHNLALCALVRGDYAMGAAYSLAALQAEPTLWMASLVHAKCQRGLGRIDAARAMLEALKLKLQGQAELAIVNAELADTLMNDFGNPMAARALHEMSGIQASQSTLEAELTEITTSFYDSEADTQAALRKITEFARKHLTSQRNAMAMAQAMAKPIRPMQRRRIGLISPFFTRSPVYFFCIGALKLLALRYDLILFSRNTHTDDATAEFCNLAAEWHGCAIQDAAALEQTLTSARLDVLIDMGGWSDVMAMQALACKPAPVIYKWVGGQSATTGMQAFDGFITDCFQSPPQSTGQHSEPLVFLEQGYVSYTPPGYLPPAQPAAAKEIILGVISNPAKMSQGFLHTLKKTLLQNQTKTPLRLRFIDRRMALAEVKARITQGLDELGASAEFIVPQGHEAYLIEVSKLTAVIDTFPYSGGLTAVEALAMGVPIIDINPAPVEQRLFCGRHAYAHAQYVKQGKNKLAPWITINTLFQQLDTDKTPDKNPGKNTRSNQQRHSYLTDSPRSDHQSLAQNIQHLINNTLTHHTPLPA